jgi:hypothetical protein
MSATQPSFVPETSLASLPERLRLQRDRFARAIEDIDAMLRIVEEHPGIDLERIAKTLVALLRLPATTP